MSIQITQILHRGGILPPLNLAAIIKAGFPGLHRETLLLYVHAFVKRNCYSNFHYHRL